MNRATAQCAAGYDWSALPYGARAAFSLPGFVMGCSFTGFGAFLAEIDFDLSAGLGSIVLIWALPGQVVFVDMWATGAGLAITALAVSVTAVRLLPMVVLVLASARLTGAPRWPEFLLAHLIAVTIWVMANRQIEAIDRPRRLPWLMGLGSALMIAMFGFTAAGFLLADILPPALTAILVFFTPAFFFLSLFANIRWRFDYLAIGLGAAIGPIATAWIPDFDLVVAGVVGGSLAFLIARPDRRSA